MIKFWCWSSMSVVLVTAMCVMVVAGTKVLAADDETPAGDAVVTAEVMDAGAHESAAASLAGKNAVALFYSIAITVGVGCVAAGYAVGKVGAAALGAASEKPELMGRALIFVGLAEGIAIYGLIIGIMLIRLLG
jgi:V/A-type H+-transporting ATPase subunit K